MGKGYVYECTGIACDVVFCMGKTMLSACVESFYIFNCMSHFMLVETKSTQTKLYSTGKVSDCGQNIVIGSDKTAILIMDRIFL